MENNYDRLLAIVEKYNSSFISYDGLEECIIGYFQEGDKFSAVYSEEKVIESFMAEGMEEEDAWDHYGYNVLGIGIEGVPYFLRELENSSEPDDGKNLDYALGYIENFFMDPKKCFDQKDLTEIEINLKTDDYFFIRRFNNE